MSAPTLVIGSLEIPSLGRVDSLTQRYEPLGGQSIFRAITGRGVNQETWKKTRITTSGAGWMPPNELWRLDTSQPLILKCVAPMMLFLPPGVATATLPVKRRADAPPFAVAVTRHSESRVPVTVNISTNLATVDLSGLPPESITGCRIGYYPQFQVIALRPSQQVDANGAVFSWELVCEEV
jgi:hypothetical protein